MRYIIKEETLTDLADVIRYKANIEEMLSPAEMIDVVGGLTTATERPINFEIVGGTTEPINPRENTIWVNTDVEIGEWQILYNEPTKRANGDKLVVGDVWMVNEDFRAVSFNILKQNNTKVSIHTPRQWNGTSWDTKKGYIYQNGEWSPISNILRVFPSTYACTEDNWTVSTNEGTFVMSSVSMYLYGHSQGSSRTLPNYPVDFSKYKTLYMNIDRMTSHNDFYFRWRRVTDSGLAVNYKVDDLDQSLWIGTHAIDISSITDECYLCFNFSNGGGGVITDIWFEE